MSWLRRFEAWGSRFDIGRKFPGYVHKWVFRVATLLLLLTVFLVFADEGYGHFWAETRLSCPPGQDCLNPLYDCMRPFNDRLLDSDCNGVDVICSSRPSLCDFQYIPAGTAMGYVPGHFAQNASVYMFFLIAEAFLINHALYKPRRVED